MPVSGTLSMVATPIGNLSDLTERARTVLGGASAILAEDTRRTAKLLAYLHVRIPLLSFHEHTNPQRRADLIRRMEAGESFVLVTDAGTPGIADPGNILVADAVRAGIRVLPIPGPSALTAALSVCGFPTDRFTFYGFLPHKKGRETLIREIAAQSETVAVFESPYRIAKTLRAFATLMPERDIAVFRELTKIYEEALRGTVSEIAAQIEANPAKQRGEFVVILGPKKKERVGGL